MNVHLETMLKLEFTPAVETETERSALIFRLKKRSQLCTEPRKVYILVREFIGNIRFVCSSVQNLPVSKLRILKSPLVTINKLSLVFSASRTNSYFSGRMFMSS
jgi:hypothetical protein